MQLAGSIPALLAYAREHGWLGLAWSSTLDLNMAMRQIIRQAQSKFAQCVV